MKCSADCPSDAKIQLLLSDDETELSQAELAHVGQCSGCQERLDQFAQAGQWQKLLHSAHGEVSGLPMPPSTPIDLPALPEVKTPAELQDTDRIAGETDRLPQKGNEGNAVRPAVSDHGTGESSDDQQRISPPQIDGYTILEHIGRGGMGVVFRAVQHGVNRMVAIKTVTEFANDPERRIRLRREAESAASIHHPGIVPVIETGESQGIAYLVQDYLPDGTLADRLKSGPLESATATQLFTEITNAVAAAHQAGIVHRDIKPANILFRGESPLLADFGLAKVLEETVDITRTAGFVGTPAYMAPEQASHDAEITTATDVFSLGVVLYEMLTGVRPFRATSPMGLLQAIQEDEPVAPKRLEPKIPNDLNTICLKCLSKDPMARYPDAGELEADLKRFMDGRPIHARPTSTMQQVLKWSRRRPALAGLTVTTLCAVLSALAIWAVMTSRLSRVNTELEFSNSELEVANEDLKVTNVKLEQTIGALNHEKAALVSQTEATKAVTNFLTNDLLGFATSTRRVNAAQDSGEEMLEPNPRILDIVQRSVREIEGEKLNEKFPDQPDAQLEILITLSAILNDLGQYEDAMGINLRALQLVPDTVGELDPGKAKLFLGLANKYASLGQFDQAFAVFEQVVSAYPDNPEHVCALLAHYNWAGHLMMQKRVEEAYQHSSFAIDASKRAFGEEDENTLVFCNLHAQILDAMQRHDEAIELLESTLEIMKQVYSEKHPRTISALDKLSAAYFSKKDYQYALDLEQQAWELSKEVNGENHPKTLKFMSQVGISMAHTGEVQKGFDIMKDATSGLEEILGPEHPYVKSMKREIEKFRTGLNLE